MLLPCSWLCCCWGSCVAGPAGGCDLVMAWTMEQAPPSHGLWDHATSDVIKHSINQTHCTAHIQSIQAALLCTVSLMLGLLDNPSLDKIPFQSTVPSRLQLATAA